MENSHQMSDKDLKNTDLYSKMESTGNVVVTGIENTKNPDIKVAFLAQLRDDVNSSEANKENSFFLGWGESSRIVRAIRSFNPSIQNLGVGDILPEQFNIQVEDREGQPFYDGQEPRKRPNGGSIIEKDGIPIFRNTSVVVGEPQHTIIKDYDREGQSVLPRVEFAKKEEQTETVHSY
jgi:hypothetical protein